MARDMVGYISICVLDLWGCLFFFCLVFLFLFFSLSVFCVVCLFVVFLLFLLHLSYPQEKTRGYI